MKFKFTIQPYQTEAVESVVNIFAGQPFNDRFTYRRDVDISRIQEAADSDPLLGFANAKVQLTAQQLLENIRKMQARGRFIQNIDGISRASFTQLRGQLNPLGLPA